MFRRKNLITCLGYVLLIGVTVYTCAGCFPTTKDVNNLAEAERTFQQGLSEGVVETMTEQHAAMTPELADAFAVMQGQYNELSAQLKAKASQAKASGPDIGALGGSGSGILQWILGLFNLGWLYPFIKGFGKSRASGEVDALKNEVAALKLNLATAAKPGSDMPSDSG